MGGYRRLGGIKSTDVAIVLYMVITALFMVIFGGFQNETFLPLAIRVVVLLLIWVICFCDTKWDNGITRFIHLLYPVLLLSYFYGETDVLNNYIFSSYLDPIVYKWDQWIFGFQPCIEFSIYFPKLWFSELLYFGYFSYYLLTIGISLIFYFFKPRLAEKVIFLIITSFLTYYILFVVFPVAGPQYYLAFPLNEVPDSGIFSRMVKLIQYYGEHPTGAFPSSHVGMVVIFLYLSFKYFRWAFFIILPLFVLIILATVYIKAHYAIDVIVGLLSAPIVYFISNSLYPIFEKKLKMYS